MGYLVLLEHRHAPPLPSLRRLREPGQELADPSGAKREPQPDEAAIVGEPGEHRARPVGTDDLVVPQVNHRHLGIDGVEVVDDLAHDVGVDRGHGRVDDLDVATVGTEHRLQLAGESVHDIRGTHGRRAPQHDHALAIGRTGYRDVLRLWRPRLRRGKEPPPEPRVGGDVVAAGRYKKTGGNPDPDGPQSELEPDQREQRKREGDEAQDPAHPRRWRGGHESVRVEFDERRTYQRPDPVTRHGSGRMIWADRPAEHQIPDRIPDRGRESRARWHRLDAYAIPPPIAQRSNRLFGLRLGSYKSRVHVARLRHRRSRVHRSRPHPTSA